MDQHVRLAVDPDGSAILGVEPNDGTFDFGDGPKGPGGVAIAKIGSDGKGMWSRHLPPGTDLGFEGLAVDPASGEVIVVGRFAGTVDLGKGAMSASTAEDDDAFVLKLSPSGQTLWAVAFGDVNPTVPAWQNAEAVGVGSDGAIAIAGHLQGPTAFGPTELVPQGQGEIFVALVETGGAPVWAKRFGTADTESVALDGAAVGPDGGIALSGSFSGTFTLGGLEQQSMGVTRFVGKLGPNGGHEWTKTFGKEQLPLPGAGPVVDSKGNVVVGGAFVGTVKLDGVELTSQGEVDAYLAKYSPSGELSWARRYGDSATVQLASGVAVEPRDGAIFVVGPNDGTIDFGGGPRSASTQIDIFLAKIAP